MRGDRERDDIVPLFPGLHINNDGDKGGPRPPPRNKMAIFDVDSEIDYRSRSTVPPRNDSVGSLVSRGSSSNNVVSGKRKVRPIFATMNECPHSADWYYPHNPTTSRGDEHTSAFIQSGKTLHFRNLQDSVYLAEENCELSHNIGHRKMGWGVGDCNQRTEIDLINHDRASKVEIAVKREESSDTCIPGLNLTTDEVVRVIGQRLFLEARKTMINQQKMLSWQMFELHTLITVQRLIARSPETLHTIKPSIKFPPMNKLLYVSPLDTSSLAKTKGDALKCDPIMDRGVSLPTTSVEKGQALPNPTPWCFPPPPGNQWLIPVKSPSEGLLYKPYPGPCFPTVGFMPPVYGGTTYSVPAPNEHGTGGCYNSEIGQSYFQPYHIPLMNASCSTNEVKGGEVDKSSFKLVYDLHTHKESERLEKDALSLFPTTPFVDVLKERKNEHKVRVIKVVPYSRNSTSASVARILQSIQERRRKHD